MIHIHKFKVGDLIRDKFNYNHPPDRIGLVIKLNRYSVSIRWIDCTYGIYFTPYVDQKYYEKA